MLRHPFAGHALGFGDLVGGHVLGDIIADPLTKTDITQRCGYVNQHIRKDAVLRKMGMYVEQVSLGCAAPLAPKISLWGVSQGDTLNISLGTPKVDAGCGNQCRRGQVQHGELDNQPPSLRTA